MSAPTKEPRFMTSALRKFDEDLVACVDLLAHSSGLKPHELQKVSDLPWSFGDFIDLAPDATPDHAGEWMSGENYKVRNTSSKSYSY